MNLHFLPPIPPGGALCVGKSPLGDLGVEMKAIMKTLEHLEKCY
jgi:hypothetical protein